ncbi:hypothetical_protein (plasmid) [Leishmania braziliensis MHOM/BR/75/M2904]|uniref:Hypothetical_protein n=1 Tax=Leishmania braziliensis MHOM/BR/75/M2904 TaxID=420245 RepID=A0A3P3YYA9_LEIBR|nr:hypothetical_protein [Leishmania braziliensis MHOM/BR/75/M2904]
MASSTRDATEDAGSSSPVFGSGVHVGRSGNVDLSGRDLHVFGPQVVNMINEDNLHRTATSLTLSNNRLYALAKELPLLSNLRELEIDHNRFQRFPECLCSCHACGASMPASTPLRARGGLTYCRVSSRCAR